MTISGFATGDGMARTEKSLPRFAYVLLKGIGFNACNWPCEWKQDLHKYDPNEPANVHFSGPEVCRLILQAGLAKRANAGKESEAGLFRCFAAMRVWRKLDRVWPTGSRMQEC